jgi:O-antigen/teichoic acid export membrane protein
VSADAAPAPDALPLSRPAEDLTGRDRIFRNVLYSWGGYLLIAVTGFILPRQMDRHVGQTALGVWDLGWSLVSYFGLAQVGVGSAVNRYIAKARAAGDVPALRMAASSVLALNLVAGGLVVLMTAGVTWALPALFGARLGADLAMARWVVALLGLSLAVQVMFDVFTGVITGCHRWDLHNVINTTLHLSTVAAMVGALWAGGGLTSLAVVNLAGTVATELVRVWAAYRVCPGLSVALRHANFTQARSVLVFGLKSSLAGLSRLLLFQTNSVVVAGHFGAAVLALYARPMALMRVVETFANKFAFVLSPTASSLQASGKSEELRELVLKGSRLGTALVSPIILTLAILGDPILRLWMGKRYEQGLVLALLVLGMFLPVAQRTVSIILVGLNLHGRMALANLVSAICGVGLSVLNVTVLGWGLPGAALAIAVPMTLGTGVFIPVYACAQLGIPLREYVRRTFVVPVACVLPWAAALTASRLAFADRPIVAIVAGLAGGSLVLVPLYWRYILPDQVKDMARRVLRQVWPTDG